MKSIVLLFASLLFTAAPALADQADQHYRQGMAAMKRGEVETARTAFQKALRARPGHAYARYQLGQLKNNADQLVATRRANQLAAIRLEAIEFDSVPLDDALGALNQLVEEASTPNEENEEDSAAEAFVPNFMVQDPSGRLGEREVSLRMKNVPAKTAFDYLLQQAGATARYEKHATIVRPAAGTEARNAGE